MNCTYTQANEATDVQSAEAIHARLAKLLGEHREITPAR